MPEAGVQVVPRKAAPAHRSQGERHTALAPARRRMRGATVIVHPVSITSSTSSTGPGGAATCGSPTRPHGREPLGRVGVHGGPRPMRARVPSNGSLRISAIRRVRWASWWGRVREPMPTTPTGRSAHPQPASTRTRRPAPPAARGDRRTGRVLSPPSLQPPSPQPRVAGPGGRRGRWPRRRRRPRAAPAAAHPADVRQPPDTRPDSACSPAGIRPDAGTSGLALEGH